MDEMIRNQIVHLSGAAMSQRQIASQLGISRRSVARALAAIEQQRGKEPSPSRPRKRCRSQPSILADHLPALEQLLTRYPNLTVVRALEELRLLGFAGGYTSVRLAMKALRPDRSAAAVVRFETTPGAQAQMDYSVYDIDFTEEGRRRVNLFSYVLSYSRRQYLRFVPSQDFETTVREHIRAFEYLGGVAATCLYDNMKVVVSGHEGDEPIYNQRFLAFATHYGYRPWACKRRRPQTKGKCERQFFYAETNLLNGRTFRSFEHLNEVTAWWLANVADIRVHRETKQRPIDRHAEEKPHLLPLPAHGYDVAPVVYRVVSVEGFISYRQNFYSVPWQYLGLTLPVRIGESALTLYSPRLEAVAHHPLLPSNVCGQRREDASHRPPDNRREQLEILQQRFAALGPAGPRFLEGLLQAQRCGKSQAERVLALLAGYRREDLCQALERAARFGAYSLGAIERILAVEATPRSTLETLAEHERKHLQPLLEEPPILPRPTHEYQHLLGTPENISDEDHSSHDQETTTPHQTDDGQANDGGGQ